MSLVDLQGLFRIMWWGFALNAVTGLVLFIAAAADKAYQKAERLSFKIFYVKLAFVFLALLTSSRIRRTVFGTALDPMGRCRRTRSSWRLHHWSSGWVRSSQAG